MKSVLRLHASGRRYTGCMVSSSAETESKDMNMRPIIHDGEHFSVSDEV